MDLVGTKTWMDCNRAEELYRGNVGTTHQTKRAQIDDFVIETACTTGTNTRLRMVQFPSRRVVVRSISAWTVVETLKTGPKSAWVQTGSGLKQCFILGFDAVVELGEDGAFLDGRGRCEQTPRGERSCQQQNSR